MDTLKTSNATAVRFSLNSSAFTAGQIESSCIVEEYIIY